MQISSFVFYALAAILQASGSSGAAMLAPFFMKAQGFSTALVGVPLVINGLGRISSDLLSGLLATYFSAWSLLVVALAVALAASGLGLFVRDVMPLFLSIWAVLGFTEAMFGLCLRKTAFDLFPPSQQGRAQGLVASAAGIGFTLGPALGGIVGTRWGAGALFFLYALPQVLALVFILLAGRHGVSKPIAAGSRPLWSEARTLLRRPPFLAACLAMFQAFLFLGGVTRVAFPFLAVAGRGLSLHVVGTIVGISRLTDTFGRLIGGWLCDRIGTARVILAGVLIGVPMFLLESYGTGFLGLLIPLSLMTMGFGFTNVGSITCALESAGKETKGVGLGLARASNSAGTILGPLLAGLLIEGFGYEGGFFAMALVSLAGFFLVWYLFRRPAGLS